MPEQIDLNLIIKTVEMENHPSFLKIREARSFEEAKEFFDLFKKEVLNQRRVLAKKYQPRKVDDCPKKMAEINNAVDIIQSLELQRPKPKPRYVSIIININSGDLDDITGAETSTW